MQNLNGTSLAEVVGTPAVLYVTKNTVICDTDTTIKYVMTLDLQFILQFAMLQLAYYSNELRTALQGILCERKYGNAILREDQERTAKTMRTRHAYPEMDG